MEIKIEQKAYEDLRKLVKKLKEISDEYKEIKDETLIRLLATAFAMGKMREEKIKNKILQEIEKEIKEVEDDLNQTYRQKPKNEIEFALKAFAAPAGERVEGYLKGLKFAREKIKKAFEELE